MRWLPTSVRLSSVLWSSHKCGKQSSAVSVINKLRRSHAVAGQLFYRHGDILVVVVRLFNSSSNNDDDDDCYYCCYYY